MVAHLHLLRRAFHSSPRSFSQIQLVAELRKRTTVSLTKAREALNASDNNIEDALRWLESDNQTTGLKKAAKLESRVTDQGLVGAVILSDGAWSNGSAPMGIRAALVEVNCETDFVARNELFRTLALDIAHTFAYLSEQPSSPNTTVLSQIPPTSFDDAPLLSHNPSLNDPSVASSTTVSGAIRDAMTKLGEKIMLRRAIIVNSPPTRGLRLGHYTHGSVNPPSAVASAGTTTTVQAHAGSIVGLVTLGLSSARKLGATSPASSNANLNTLLTSSSFSSAYTKLARATARHVVALEPKTIQAGAADADADKDVSSAFYDQPALMYGARDVSVRAYLDKWQVEQTQEGGEVAGLQADVLEMARWKVGEREQPQETDGTTKP